MPIIAQIIGIVAMAAIILSYQFKSPKKLMACQLVGTFLFMVNMIMIGAVTGAIMNLLGFLRSLVYMKPERLRIPLKVITALFVTSYIISYACVFLFLGTEPTVENLLLEFLPIIGMVAVTIGFASNNSKTIRRLGLINSPCWLTYNIFHFSIGGILCEAFGIVSILSATVRHDLKKQSKGINAL